jgi:hypothetical protein
VVVAVAAAVPGQTAGGVVPEVAVPELVPDVVPDPAVPDEVPLGATVPDPAVPDDVPDVVPLGATVPEVAVPDDVPDVVPLGAIVPVAAFVPVAADDPETEAPEVEPDVAGCVPPLDAQPWRRPSTASAPNALKGATTRQGLDKFKAWAEKWKRAIGNLVMGGRSESASARLLLTLILLTFKNFHKKRRRWGETLR